MEASPDEKKFCYDITKKAEFLLSLKSHLFPVEVRQEINEEIEKYNCKEFRWDYENFDKIRQKDSKQVQ